MERRRDGREEGKMGGEGMKRKYERGRGGGCVVRRKGRVLGGSEERGENK